jgi:hypothetical protein
MTYTTAKGKRAAGDLDSVQAPRIEKNRRFVLKGEATKRETV